MTTQFFKSRGHELAYYLTVFTGTQLFSRLGVTWKHYKNMHESLLLVTDIKNTIMRDVKDDVISISPLLLTLDEVYADLIQP